MREEAVAGVSEEAGTEAITGVCQGACRVEPSLTWMQEMTKHLQRLHNLAEDARTSIEKDSVLRQGKSLQRHLDEAVKKYPAAPTLVQPQSYLNVILSLVPKGT